MEIKGDYKESTKKMYQNMLKKLNINDITQLHDHDKIIELINTSLNKDSYKIMAYKAINAIYSDPIYNNEYKKLQNNNNNKDNIGKLPMTLEELLNIKVKCDNPIQELVESFTIYINTHYPLRLDYFNIVINPAEKENFVNYMTYSDNKLVFYLNDFKNVKSLGCQVIEYCDEIISNYINKLTEYFGVMPEFLLYRYDKPTNTLKTFSSRIMYGGYLQDILRKYTNKELSINIIRKIHESNLIQSDEYRKMSNKDKRAKHLKLLHSTAIANESYNIIDRDEDNLISSAGIPADAK